MRAHRAVLDRSPDAERRECAVCGRPVTGADNDLRHLGEERAIEVIPSPAAEPAFTAAVQTGATALRRLSERASDDERSRAVIEALLRDGLIAANARQRKAAAKRPAVLL